MKNGKYLSHLCLYNASFELHETEKKLLKRPVKNEITHKIWEIIEKRFKTKHKPYGYINTDFCTVGSGLDGEKYTKSGFIKETEEYNSDDIATAILKYCKANNVIIPFGLTVGGNNIAIYKKDTD